MAEIRRFPVLRHARVNPTSHLLLARRGRVVRSGRGLSVWFRPLTDSVAEIPVDDRDLALMIRGRSADYQDVTVTGVLTYRVLDPELLAKRVDFALDPKTGRYAHEPIERVEAILSQLAQEEALRYLTHTPVRAALADGIAQLREAIAAALATSPQLPELGLAIAAVRITAVWPNPDLATAIEAPARERIKQESDEAAYHRRALAVEKERAIAENEMQNRIELARREEQLVEQQGQNAKREAENKAESARIAAEAEAERVARVGAATQQLEAQRISAMESAPARVLAALAAMAFAPLSPFRRRSA
jgi:regulator of protease activity HflC (stomatin/prohibitin superfamily)